MGHLILASGSPRRKELLKMIGIPFEIVVSQIQERLDDQDAPGNAAISLALQKAKDVQFRYPDATVIGADTIVTYNSKLLGKPKTREDAKNMLQLLSGNTHEVFTGVAIVSREKIVSFYERTEVTFYPITQTEIDSYIATGEPFDKAGSYGIQGKGALFVKEIHGDYYSVVGLPIARVARKLKMFK